MAARQRVAVQVGTCLSVAALRRAAVVVNNSCVQGWELVGVTIAIDQHWHWFLFKLTGTGDSKLTTTGDYCN